MKKCDVLDIDYISGFSHVWNAVSHKQLASEEVEKFPNLIAFIERIEKLPKIADFLTSDRSPKPMNNKMAKFGFEWSAFFFLSGSRDISCKHGNEINVSFWDKTQMNTYIN